MEINNVGDGRVILIAGGGQIYTDVAARFVGSERGLDEIVGSEHNKEIVKNIVKSGHEAVTEFDWFIFGVEGYSRVTETQLVRKRLASYMIKSGRKDKEGNRGFDMVFPKSILGTVARIPVSSDFILVDGVCLPTIIPNINKVTYSYDGYDVLKMIEKWYEKGVSYGIPEEELRYLKPQATEFKAVVGMNAHALRDWFRIRCCKNAQTEIRDMANKMFKICKEVTPELFEDAGPNCVRLGYCPENDLQHSDCEGKVLKKDKALEILASAREGQ